VLGLYNKREAPEFTPHLGSTSNGEIDIVGVVRIVYSLIEVSIAIVVGKSLGLLSPAQVVCTVVLFLTIVEVNVDTSVKCGIFSGVRIEGKNCTKNGEGLGELIVQFNGKSCLRGTGDALNSEVLVDVSSKMRITFNQTKSSVLGLSGIPVGFSEALKVLKILRNTFIAILGVRLMFVVAVFNMPLGIFLIVQFSWNVAYNGSGNNILPFLYVTISGDLIELSTTLNLESIISHLIEETR
jgi:hypothetical protein